jgi:hypothetical protein
VRLVVQGQIRRLDPAKRLAVIGLDDGSEVTVTFPPKANIEVREPSTMGTMGGSLEDLHVGYWVNVEIHEHGNSPCSCSSLVCIS